MSLLLKLNRVTSRAVAFLLLASLRVLALHQLMFIIIPFLFEVESGSFFLINLALIPLAAILLLISSLIYVARRIRGIR
ncbi:hypothetical protein [Metallosphaera hakonensis]|uniref:hypothetical protein n=1 Tax=Metallosphaera hakonensis TaxID=79601 RepID=UPI0011B22C7F|nr:hypothetical protein [Metallosphaera hakonensis]